MKFNKKLKKGFTLVELIVVIAIVAILAAVSVVSYLAFINSANESADIQLVKQLNTCLQADEALHGKKDWSEDYTGLTSLLESNGFIVENLTKTKSGCDMVYQGRVDENTIINRYALLKGNDVLYSETTFAASNNHRNLWIPDTLREAEDLAAAGKGVVLGEELGDIDTFNAKGSVIVDGANVKHINYSNNGASQTVVIRTNGGTLTIDAPDDDINHYDYAESVNIVEVKSSSYHENGTVPFIQISKGNIVLEETADVNGIHVANVQTYNSSTGEYDKTANTFSHDVVLTLNGSDVKLTRDTVGTNLDQPVLVCEVKADSTSDEYIWLYGNGTIEDAKVYVTSTNSTPDITQPSETSVDNASKAAKAIANNAVVEAGKITSVSDAGKPADEAQAASALKGTGTHVDPFLIYDYITMQKISDFYDIGYYYFAVDMSKTDNGKIDCKDWIPVNINGSFDGKGVTFTSLNNYLFWNVGNNMSDSATFKNFNIYNCNIVLTKSAAAVARNVDDYGCQNLTLENVNITGYIEGQGQTASFIAYPGSGVLTFKNCTSTAKVVAIGDCAAGFVVNPYKMLSSFGGTAESKIVLDNSYFEGSLSTTKTTKYKATGASSWAGTNAAGAYVYAHNIGITTEIINENPDKASLHVSQVREGMHERLWYNNDKVSAIIANNPLLDLTNVNYGQTFTMSRYSAEVSYVTISMIVSPNNTEDTGSFTGTYFTERVEVTGDTFESSVVKKYNVAINGSCDGTTLNQVSTNGKTGITSDGTTLNIVNSYYGYTHNGVAIVIVQYNSSGDVIAYTSNTYISKTTN